MERVIAKIKKSTVNEIWVVLSDFTGETKLNIREYFLAGDDKGFLPTKKGISFPLDEVGAVRDAVEALANATEEGTACILLKMDRSEVRAAIRKYEGHTYAELRTFIPGKDASDEWRPTQKGFTINPRLVPLLVAAIGELEDNLEE